MLDHHPIEIPEDVWRLAVLPTSATIRDAVQNLNDVGIRIVLVLDEDRQLTGTISDGDIRRGLLRGLSLDDSSLSVLHRNALVAPVGMDHDMILHLMLANKIQQIPLVDEDNRVVGLRLWNELGAQPYRSNPFVIMAGGQGVRLRPHTENCPKPMLLVAGRPILEHILERAKREGFQNFVFAVGYLGHIVEDYFGDGSRFGVSIEYLRERQPLGTAGALSLLAMRHKTPALVTNGDVLSDIRYGELLDFHLHQQAAATMAVRLHEWQQPFGVVKTQGIDIIGFEEKPIIRTQINVGVYVLAPSALGLLRQGEPCDMPTLFEMLQARSSRVVAYPMHEPWLDVGRPEDLRLARAIMSSSSSLEAP